MRQTSSFSGVDAERSAVNNLINRALKTFRYELTESGEKTNNDMVWTVEIKVAKLKK